jgi:hypothetical protein
MKNSPYRLLGMFIIVSITASLITHWGEVRRNKNVLFYNIQFQVASQDSIDVMFDAYNGSKDNLINKQTVIRLYDISGDKIASKFTPVILKSGENLRYHTVLTNLTKAIKDRADISRVTVEVYQPKTLL